MFSVATTGGTTSESTPTVGGVMALLLSYGKKAAAENLIESPLTNDEAIQVARATSSDIAGNPNPPGGWEGKPGFDLQYGYGRPNVHKAMQAIHDGDIPPVAWFKSPEWYSLYDPTKTSSVPVTGHVDAPRSEPYTWKLEFAPGAEPTDAQFITANSGSRQRPDRRLTRNDRPEPGAAVVLGRRLPPLERKDPGDERAVHGHPPDPGDRR